MEDEAEDEWEDIDSVFHLNKAIFLDTGGRFRINEGDRWEEFTLSKPMEAMVYDYGGEDFVVEVKPNFILRVWKDCEGVTDVCCVRYRRSVWQAQIMQLFSYNIKKWIPAGEGVQENKFINLHKDGDLSVMTGGIWSFCHRTLRFDNEKMVVGQKLFPASFTRLDQNFSLVIEYANNDGAFKEEYLYRKEEWFMRKKKVE